MQVIGQRGAVQRFGDAEALRALDPNAFVGDSFGLPTVRDIIAELEKPGRDPRPGFKTAEFKEGVNELKDLQPGMVLEGTVTNVAAFGAFVDVGVHQDGLVHVSQLSDRFVKDPYQVVKAGDVVKVRVVEVDVKRKRIALTMKSRDDAARSVTKSAGSESRPRPKAATHNNKRGRKAEAQPTGSLGAALFEALRNKSD